ncbi:Alpha/Beta hydrolase protein [Cokeromyces recurvatus]|uniref:Alpha/Beta hydrolase protein n=1 Tax=Cokeromyces recurvatus TaxID=90255 RepID=UPI002220A710|nr:Alpha/Beta hydrolase protein [Cokeromyces recurvatus]KAI7906392.1 Alpha/Beta hydrolase protein [Cokeromyces recurvatus]
MSWIQTNTLYVSASLFCLPLLVLCIFISLPFLIFITVILYLNAWFTYYMHAQTDITSLKLPLNPSRIMKINLAAFDFYRGWIKCTPLVISYLYWRFWEIGSSQRFKQIVSLNIPYYGNCKLDIYHPEKKTKGRQEEKKRLLSPIVIFIYGGGWGSGNKMIYSTLANTLRELGYVVIVPDYRKYPEVKINEIYKDIREAIKWSYKHALEFNGDPEQIYLMGHSAGAQLAAQVVLSDVIEQVKYDQDIHSNQEAITPPNTSEKHDPIMEKKIDHLYKHHMLFSKDKSNDFLPLVEGLILFSGVYDVASHYIHETSRGVETISAMARVMGMTEEGYVANSPLHLIETNSTLFSNSEELLDLWPRILFVHGQKDLTVGMDQTANIFNTLGQVFPFERRQEVDVRMRLYKRMGHSDPILCLMPNLFYKNNEKQLILRDIQEFINLSSLQ